MKNKSDVYDLFQQYEKDVLTIIRATSTGNKMIWMHSDYGEFNLATIRVCYQCRNSVLYYMSICTRTKWSHREKFENNWRSSNSTILTCLSETYWEEARNCAGFIYNRLPRKGNDLNKSPYELYFNRKAHISYFKMFGSTAYVQKLVMGLQFNQDDSVIDSDTSDTPFREAVGSAMYPITCCHPEAQYAIGVISLYRLLRLSIGWHCCTYSGIFAVQQVKEFVTSDRRVLWLTFCTLCRCRLGFK